MFKNRELRVKMVKPADPVESDLDPERIAELAKEVILYGSLAFVSVYASKVTLELVREIIWLKVDSSH